MGEGDYQGHLSALALTLEWCLEHGPILVTKEETVWLQPAVWISLPIKVVMERSNLCHYGLAQ